ncbi:MAG: UDP-N-acetylmuramoyl-L-alanyl-D-glutamate--2,6-diaminopimelate ligase, partial [Myxococcota bacterium]
GKTTVTYVLESIIRAASKKVGVMGTVECRFPGHREAVSHTTPDAVSLEAQMAKMLDHGVTHVAMEVSSHALDQKRVAGLHFKVAGFTNLSQDHLDYHKTLDAYFEAKARLFSEFLRKSRARGRMAVVNVDDPYGEKILERWGGKSLRVSLDPKSEADIVALEATYKVTGTEAKVRTSKGVWDIETCLVGEHNLSNVLVAMGMALAMGFSKARILRGLQALERVPGRLEKVPNDGEKMVLVDYAHTPDALQKTLEAVRAVTEGRLIVVFGCGGDRDQQKRPLMGEAVASNADLAVVTNDNPRYEDPAKIAEAIEEGLKKGGFERLDEDSEPKPESQPENKRYRIELDRRAAMRFAVDWMAPGDVLIIAGKGHEDYQIIAGKKHRFDDREEARRILAGLPPPPPMLLEDNNTAEVDVEQVVDAYDLLDDVPAVPAANTMQVDADAIVDAVDIEPEILSEEKTAEKKSTDAASVEPSSDTPTPDDDPPKDES